MKKEKKQYLCTDFYIRRIHSILGIVPIGIFLCLHLTLNSSAILGVDAWEAVIDGMRSVPFIILGELFIIAIPILFHAIYGFYIVYLSDMPLLRYQYVKNWMFILQRVTAVITTIFVIDHVLFVRILTDSTLDVMSAMANALHTPVGFILELIGIWASIFHFTNGIFTFLVTWGVLQGDRVQKVVSFLTMLLCAALCLLALIILIRIAMMPI